MANLMLGYRNQVANAVLTASSAAPGLGPANLQTDQGNAASAWQTTGTSATLQIDAGNDNAAWRAFLLARTNLSTAATVRWRVGPAEALVEAPRSLAQGFQGATAASLSAAGFAFTRNSPGTLPDPATGFFASFAANQPRSNGLGLLMEGAATNLFGWNDSATTGQGAGGNAIAQSGGSAGPGAVTTQCTYNGPDSNVYFIGMGGLTSGQYYVASWLVYIPGAATLSSLTLAWEGNAANGYSVNANLAIRDRFQLVWCRAQINAATSAAVMRIGGAPAGTQVFVCAKQVETGTSPTSFIATAGGAAASRAADLLSIGGPVAAACASGSYTLAALANWATPPPAGGALDVFLQKSGVANTAMARFASVATGIAFNGSGVQSYAATQAYNVAYSRIVVAVSPGAFGFAAFGGGAQSAANLPAAQLPDVLIATAGGNASVLLANLALYPARLSQAQIQALATGGATVTGNTTFDSGTVPAGIAPGYGQSLVIAASQAAGRVAQLDISDPGNPDGFLNIPLAYAGPVLQPMRNYDYSSAHGRVAQAAKKVSRSGSVTGRTDWVKRVFELSLSGIRAVEMAQFQALDAYARTGGNVLLVPDPASATRAQEALYGEFEPTANFGYPLQTPEARSYRATVTERL